MPRVASKDAGGSPKTGDVGGRIRRKRPSSSSPAGDDAKGSSRDNKKRLADLKSEKLQLKKRAKWIKQAKKRAREDLKKELLVMQGYAVTFDTGVFLRMLLYHVTYPLCLPFVWWCEGETLCHNLRFFIHTPGDFFFGLLPNLLVFATLFLYFLEPTPELRAVCGGVEVAAVACILLIQRLTIATKYAYMPAEQYQQYASRRLSDGERGRVELGTGWMRMPPMLVKQGIESAAMRLGSDATKRYFVFDDRDLPAVRELLQSPAHGSLCDVSVKDLVEGCFLWGQSWELAMTTNRVSVPLLCMYLTLVMEDHARRDVNLIYRVGWPVLSITHAAMPFISRFADGRPLLGTHPTTIFVALAVPVVSSVFLAVIIMFLYVGVLDYWRRYAYMRRVGALLKPSLKDPTAQYELPVVSLRVPSNYRSWLIARRILLNFGLEYWRRIQLNTTFMTAAIAGVLFWFAVELLDDTLQTSLTAFAMLDAFVIFSVLFPMLWYGSITNATSDEHISVFLEAQVDIRDELAALPHLARGVGALGDERSATGAGPRFMTGMREVPLSADGGSSSSLSGRRTIAGPQSAAPESHIVTDALGAAAAPVAATATVATTRGEAGRGTTAQPPPLRHSASERRAAPASGGRRTVRNRLTHSVPLAARGGGPPGAGTAASSPHAVASQASTGGGQSGDAAATAAAVLRAARESGLPEATVREIARRAGVGVDPPAGSISPSGAPPRSVGSRSAGTEPSAASQASSVVSPAPANQAQSPSARSAGSTFVPPVPPPPGAPRRQRTAEGGTLEVDLRVASARLLEQCDSMCLAIVYGLESDAFTSPIRLLGVKADSLALRSIVVLSASIASLLWGLYNARG